MKKKKQKRKFITKHLASNTQLKLISKKDMHTQYNNDVAIRQKNNNNNTSGLSPLAIQEQLV